MRRTPLPLTCRSILPSRLSSSRARPSVSFDMGKLMEARNAFTCSTQGRFFCPLPLPFALHPSHGPLHSHHVRPMPYTTSPVAPRCGQHYDPLVSASGDDLRRLSKTASAEEVATRDASALQIARDHNTEVIQVPCRDEPFGVAPRRAVPNCTVHTTSHHPSSSSHTARYRPVRSINLNHHSTNTKPMPKPTPNPNPGLPDPDSTRLT